ncbi:MAG TPA: GNAT family protein [Candidatus Bathyarchaeia archaeon]|nr:GNAT family protein [Candidatus Bathyarchaeia archaeon]
MFGPALTGPRITLRPPSLRDIPRFRRWLADPEIARYWWTREVPWARRPAIAAVILFIGGLRPDAMLWTIAHDREAIGHCLIRQIDRGTRQATAAVLIGKRSDQGKGFAAEAIAIRNEFVFERLGLRSLRATALAGNAASRRVLEKSGYRLVGKSAGGPVVGGQQQDLLLFELTRTDYTRQRGTET